MFKLLINPFYSPIDLGGPTGTETGDAGPTGTSKEDIIEFLKEDDEVIDLEDDDKTPVKTDKKEDKTDKSDKKDDKKGQEKDDTDDDEDEDEDDEEEDDVDELEEIEKELEGPTDEQLELVTPARRRDILKKFPTLFKEFPYLEKAYYREQQFTELFPTINDAKLATDKASTLDKFEADITGGNTETILKMVHEKSPKSFAKIVDSYLITLGKIDQNAYHHVIGNTIKHTAIAMIQEAARSKDENLQNAALLLNKFVFGSTEIQAPKNLAEGMPDDKGEDEVSKRERAFAQRQYITTRDDLNTRVTNSLKATIEANIDPKNSMTDYVKRNASRESLETLTSLVQKDTRFTNLLKKLWEAASQNNYDRASVDRIRAAYLSKAKTLLPAVIKKSRTEALKGMGRKGKPEGDEDTQDTTKESRPRKGQQDKEEKPSSQQRDGRPVRKGKITNAKDIPAGMRSIDFLMED